MNFSKNISKYIYPNKTVSKRKSIIKANSVWIIIRGATRPENRIFRIVICLFDYFKGINFIMWLWFWKEIGRDLFSIIYNTNKRVPIKARVPI